MSPKPARKASKQILTVSLFNVGQGDHLLLELPDGTFGLIDFHYEPKINYGLEPPALTYLKQRHTPESPVVLSFICISHPDLDHTKGVKAFIDWIDANEIDVERLWLYPGINEGNVESALKKVIDKLDKIDKKNSGSHFTAPPPGFPSLSDIRRLREDLTALWEYVERWKPRSPDLIQGIHRLDNLGGSLEICAMAPLGRHTEKTNTSTIEEFFLWSQHKKEFALRDRNRVSLVIKIKFGKHQLLFGGDTGESVWQGSLNEFDRKHKNKSGPCYASYRSNFIKASHHGSKNSSSVQLWKRLLAETTYIGVSAGSRYRYHPAHETISDIKQAAKDRGSAFDILTTNLCEQCLVGKELTEEPVPWLPQDPKRPEKKPVTDALRKHSPGKFEKRAVQTKGRVSRFAMQALAKDLAVPSEAPEIKSLAAYVFRFDAKQPDVQVHRATMLCAQPKQCIYGYKGKKRFPDCSRPAPKR